MKGLKLIVFCVLFHTLGLAQRLDEASILFKPIELNTTILSNINSDNFTIYSEKDTFSMLHESTIILRPYNTEALNKKLFSNIEIIENTYRYCHDLSLLCGPLEDGVANTIDPNAEAMLGHILSNFLSNYIFE